MTDRHQPAPSSPPPTTHDFPELDEAMAQLRLESAAFRELCRQRDLVETEAAPITAAMTSTAGHTSGPAIYDITRIWRTAQADPTGQDSPGHRTYMSPKRFVNGWSRHVDARHDGPKGQILVNRSAAIYYAQLLDTRIMEANFDALEKKHQREMLADPIGHALAVCRGGPFAIMCSWPKVQIALGMSTEQLAFEVIERAKDVARGLDDLAAESLLSNVRQAIARSPRLEVIKVEDGKAG